MPNYSGYECVHCDSLNVRFGDIVEHSALEDSDTPTQLIMKTVHMHCRDCGENWTDLID